MRSNKAGSDTCLRSDNAPSRGNGRGKSKIQELTNSFFDASKAKRHTLRQQVNYRPSYVHHDLSIIQTSISGFRPWLGTSTNPRLDSRTPSSARSHGPGPSSNTSTPPYRRDPAASILADEMSGPPQLVHAGLQDPFAYYKAFRDASMSSTSHTHECEHNDDGHTCCTGVITANDNQATLLQQQASARAVPYNLAVRLANRSNGAPLTTIIEQGSYSTLNSFGSRLSLGQFSPGKVAENISPNRASHRVPQSRDEHALQRIQENVLQELNANEEPHEKRGRSCPPNNTFTPPESIPAQLSQRPGAQIGGTYTELDSRGFKGVLRGFLQNVRATSRTLSRSSSTMHASFVDFQEEGADTSESSSEDHLQTSQTSQLNNERLDIPYLTRGLCLNAAGPESQARNRKVSKANSAPSARASPPLLNLPPPRIPSQTGCGSVPHLLPPSVATRSREPSPSVDLVQPEPRDAAHVDGTGGAPTLSSERRHDTSAGYTFEGVPVLHNSTHALMDVKRARESSLNASFCSTLSTSYSGTILGVDLDLYHEFPHPVCHSRSPTPVAPVWFTPQKAAFKRQSSCSESPESTQAPPIEPHCRSITSSALTSLLPIAAASGIVRPNHDTPKISFYSPSGNLIQPEADSTPMASASDFGELSTMVPSDRNENTPLAQTAFSAAAYLPPARPSLLPMTTPPTSFAPLPAHLRYHHNYRHHEKSQIDSYDTVIEHGSAVRGCDGVVRTSTFPPRGEVERSHHKRHCSTRSVIDDMKSEVNYHKAHNITWASSAFCMSSRDRKKLRKRHSTNDNGAAAKTYTKQRRKRTTRGNLVGNVIQANQTSQEKHDKELLGPLAGHVLRICFCQPYDGVGRQTLALTTGDLCSSKTPSTHHTNKAEHGIRVKDKDVDLPAARVVDRGNDHKGPANRKRKKTVNFASNHTITRSDSAVSVGVSLRVALAGG